MTNTLAVVRVSPFETTQRHKMLLAILLLLFVSVNCESEDVDIRVLSPKEVIIEVPKTFGNGELLDFRIGIKRKGLKGIEDLVRGDFLKDNRIVIREENLGLKAGDTLTYLITVKDDEAYKAQTGIFVFDGVYEAGRRLIRRRRHIHSSESSLKKFHRDSEEFDNYEPDYGVHQYPHRGHHGHRGPPFGHPDSGFNPFGHPHHGPPHHGRPHHGPPHHGPPHFPDFPNQGGFPKPDFGADCNDHRHDACHGKGRGNDDGEDIDDTRYVTSKSIEETTIPTSSLSPDIDVRSGSK